MLSKDETAGLLTVKNSTRIGLYENIWPDTLSKWENEGYPKGVSPQDYFKFDICRVGITFDVYPKVGVHNIIEDNDKWHIIQNGAGASLKYWKNKSGTPEHIHFLMTNPHIWREQYRNHLLSVDMNRFRFEESRKAFNKHRDNNQWVCYNGSFIWELMRQSMGDVCMYESLALEPEWIHDFNTVYTEFYIKHYKVLFEEVGIPDGIWISDDLAYKNGLFCSLQMLNDMFFPYYKQLIDFFHSYNIPVILHSCGNVTEALPLIVDIGFDALHPMEIKAGCSPLKFAEIYGNNLAFIGGLDARILESGDKVLIKKSILELINGMKSLGASYFFSSDHSLSPIVSFESYQYALSIYEENK